MTDSRPMTDVEKRLINHNNANTATVSEVDAPLFDSDACQAITQAIKGIVNIAILHNALDDTHKTLLETLPKVHPQLQHTAIQYASLLCNDLPTDPFTQRRFLKISTDIINR